MPHPFALRSLIVVACSQLILSACTAQGRDPASAVWPEPRPQATEVQKTQSAEARPPALKTPDFQAPSAPHCRRPIQTRELPGRPAGWTDQGAGDARATRKTYAPGARLEALPAPAPADALAEAAEPAREMLADERANPATSRLPSPPHQRRPGPVTAGMVDDNADFAAYLAFRERTQVVHRARDVSERYQLLVKDREGRPVPDAEVAVRSSRGASMWARTDAGGRIWLHPDAFDPWHASVYDVTVRQGTQQAHGFLQRDQKSAVEITLSPTQARKQAQLDLVFLIDATGSMADEINKLKASLADIAREVSRLPSQPDLCFGMVAYRDKGDAFLLRSHDFTDDLNAFQGVLNALQAAGGGDTPEAMNEALHETVHQLSWRGDGTTRLVVLLADAPPHLDYDGPQYDNDMLAALGKGIKIFSVGASGLDRQGEYIQRQIAQYTGGRFVFLTYADASQPGSSGPGRETSHDVSGYSVDTLDRLIVKLVREELGAFRAWSAESENEPQRGQFLQGSQAHSQAMGQEDCEKWTAAAHLQPATSKSDRLLTRLPSS